MTQLVYAISIQESTNLKEIQNVLDSLLYVPNIQLKPKIIAKLCDYLVSKFSDPQYKLRVFIAYRGLEPCGFVIAQIHPTYTSYSRKCGTFGWLLAEEFEVCQELIYNCERFIKENKIRKIRGNINFPKHLGGIGFQTLGFEAPMMCGIAFNNPKSKIRQHIERLGYLNNAEYSCVHVTDSSWEQGQRKLDEDIRIAYLTIDQMLERKEEIRDVIQGSFQVLLPDSSGGDTGFNEILEFYKQVPESFYKLPNDFDPYQYSNRKEYREAWDNCNLEKVVTWAPFAFDRKTDAVVGVIFSIPNLYQLWLNEPLTHTNVDTAMVHKEYARKGIFSNLNNIGQITLSFNGINYVEGTTIWSNNEKAVAAIFPHSKLRRKHIVYQKRI
ncbi:MAG: hypothetical protein KGD65_14580 [Candidatus Lokiarchaeota archaeon]|nr:hypothetical protein [Candidatus Lokiarchaeota archaeon]